MPLGLSAFRAVSLEWRPVYVIQHFERLYYATKSKQLTITQNGSEFDFSEVLFGGQRAFLRDPGILFPNNRQG